MALEKFVRLHNGVQMPLLGLGTTHNGGYNHETVLYALNECEYSLIDTAKRYGTEEFIGHAITECNRDRADLFLTTKLWPTDYGFGNTLSAFAGSTKRLQTDYLDLYLLHWPEVPTGVSRKDCLEETWRTMELLLESEKCRAIGVSNFQECHLNELIEFASVTPHVNQCEFHPYNNPVQLRQLCIENKIQFQGYCPLGKGSNLEEPSVVRIASELRMTPAQLLIRWSVQNNVVSIPKSTKKERVFENSQVLGERYHIPEDHMNELNELQETEYKKKIIDLERMKHTIDSNLPDGYKLKLSQNCLPKLSKSIKDFRTLA